MNNSSHRVPQHFLHIAVGIAERPEHAVSERLRSIAELIEPIGRV